MPLERTPPVPPSNSAFRFLVKVQQSGFNDQGVFRGKAFLRYQSIRKLRVSLLIRQRTCNQGCGKKTAVIVDQERTK